MRSSAVSLSSSSHAHVPTLTSALNSPHSTLSVLTSEVCNFIDVCIHTILCERSLYPSGLFESRRAYGLPVVVSRHPTLTSYISQISQNVRVWLLPGVMHKFVLAVTMPPRSAGNPHATPKVVERFVFEICLMPPHSLAKSTNGTSDTSNNNNSNIELAASPFPSSILHELHTQFASALRRLNACNGHFTNKRPVDCTWTILMYTNQPKPQNTKTGKSNDPADATKLNWMPVPLTNPASTVHASVTGQTDIVSPYFDWPMGGSRVMSMYDVRLPRLVHMEVWAEAEAESDVS
jgi:hypothetical protein